MDLIVLDLSDFSEEIEILERFHYEVDARAKIINLMVEDGIDEKDNIYSNYWEKYLEYIKAYDLLKQQFYQNHLSQYDKGIWQLDFLNKKVTIKI